MGNFLKGLVVGALIPTAFAYLCHRQTKYLSRTVERELACIEQVVEGVDAMDRQARNWQKAVRIWDLGGDYEMVEPLLARHNNNYAQGAMQVRTALQDRVEELSEALGTNYRTQAKSILGKLKGKGNAYLHDALPGGE